MSLCWRESSAVIKQLPHNLAGDVTAARCSLRTAQYSGVPDSSGVVAKGLGVAMALKALAIWPVPRATGNWSTTRVSDAGLVVKRSLPRPSLRGVV